MSEPTLPDVRVSTAFGAMSPVVTVNGQPSIWLEGPMLLRRAEREFWTQQLSDRQ